MLGLTLALDNWNLCGCFYSACVLFRLESTLLPLSFKLVVLFSFICLVNLCLSLLIKSLCSLDFRICIWSFNVDLIWLLHDFLNLPLFSFQVWLKCALFKFALINLFRRFFKPFLRVNNWLVGTLSLSIFLCKLCCFVGKMNLCFFRLHNCDLGLLGFLGFYHPAYELKMIRIKRFEMFPNCQNLITVEN